ncbi:MAG: NDP-sugar synthase [Planctomycetota bacterium]
MKVAGIILGGAHVWKEAAFDSLGPRLLLPVANAPLVGYTLAWLRSGGVRAVVLCANEGVHPLQAALADGHGHGCELFYAVDRVPRGPAGAARDAVGLCPAAHYVVVEGSLIPRLPLADLLAAHVAAGAAATIAVAADPAEDDEPVGVFMFARPALELVPPTGFHDLKEMLIPQLHAAGRPVQTWPAPTSAPRVHDLASYLAAQAWALAQVGAGVFSRADYRWANGVGVHRTARVAAGARLLGPVMVGPASRVAAAASFVGPVVVGAGCRLESDCLVTDAVLWDRCTVGVGVRVEAAVLATGAAVAGPRVVRGIVSASRARPHVLAAR